MQPLIYLLLAGAVVYFLWGIYKFVAGQNNEENQEEGKKHMVWGIVGLVIMVSVWGILNFIQSTLTSIK
ncbi:MAG: pilin [Candidatus Pacebacteria bacterium]|nr:pilin [Candidatus Paceibacterota bacterium]